MKSSIRLNFFVSNRESSRVFYAIYNRIKEGSIIAYSANAVSERSIASEFPIIIAYEVSVELVPTKEMVTQILFGSGEKDLLTFV